MSISGTNEATQSVPFGTAPPAVATGASSAGTASTPARSDHTHSFDPPVCRLWRSSAQAISHNTTTVVTFDTQRYDTDSMHSLVSNTSRITINTAGVYSVKANVRWETDATVATRLLQIVKNGATVLAEALDDGGVGVLSQFVACDVKLAAADYVEVFVYHFAGETRNIMSASDKSPVFSAAWVGRG